jgi:hypothetical protein
MRDGSHHPGCLKLKGNSDLGGPRLGHRPIRGGGRLTGMVYPVSGSPCISLIARCSCPTVSGRAFPVGDCPARNREGNLVGIGIACGSGELGGRGLRSLLRDGGTLWGRELAIDRHRSGAQGLSSTRGSARALRDAFNNTVLTSIWGARSAGVWAGPGNAFRSEPMRLLAMATSVGVEI